MNRDGKLFMKSLHGAGDHSFSVSTATTDQLGIAVMEHYTLPCVGLIHSVSFQYGLN